MHEHHVETSNHYKYLKPSAGSYWRKFNMFLYYPTTRTYSSWYFIVCDPKKIYYDYRFSRIQK